MLSIIRRYLPHLLVGLAISGIMLGAYAAVGFSASNVPKATWQTNPASIAFQASSGQGSTTDSVTCNPGASDLVFNVHVSKPNRLSLSADPGFFSCNSRPQSVTLTAKCLVPETQCAGSYEGIVQIRQPANYRDIPANLKVTIVVS
jgi:hypothetical protein